MPVEAIGPSRPALVQPHVDGLGAQPVADRPGLPHQLAGDRAGVETRGPVGGVPRRRDPQRPREGGHGRAPRHHPVARAHQPRPGVRDVGADGAGGRLVEGPLAGDEAGRGEGQADDLGVGVLERRAGGRPLVQEEEGPQAPRIGAHRGQAVGPDAHGQLGLLGLQVGQAHDVPGAVQHHLVHALLRRQGRELVGDHPHEPPGRVGGAASGADRGHLGGRLVLVAGAEGAPERVGGRAHVVWARRPRRRHQHRLPREGVPRDRAQEAFRRLAAGFFAAALRAGFSPPPSTFLRRDWSMSSWSSDFALARERAAGFFLAGGFSASALLLHRALAGLLPAASAGGEAGLQRGHQVDDRRRRGRLLRLGHLLAVGLRLEELQQRGPGLVGVGLRVERLGEALDELLGHRELVVRHLDALEALDDLLLVAQPDVLGVVERLEREHPVHGAQQHQVLLGGEHEPAHRGPPGALHGPGEQGVGALGALLRLEPVRALEEDRVDLRQLHELEDLDRLLLARREALQLRVLDRQVAALRDLPALHRVVGAHLDVAVGVPALLLHGLPRGPREGAEAHVAALLREAHRHRDRDQSEADEAIPDRAHRSPPEVVPLSIPRACRFVQPPR